MQPRTHQEIDPRLSGRPETLEPGRARVVLETTGEHRADAEGLVHGGFVFALADHAAMLAVNEPTVVLAKAAVEFLAPARVGEVLVADARVREAEGRRRHVEVTVSGKEDDAPSFRGTFECVVPTRHVLDRPSPGSSTARREADADPPDPPSSKGGTRGGPGHPPRRAGEP